MLISQNYPILLFIRLAERTAFKRAISVVTNLSDIKCRVKLPDCPLCRSSRDLFTTKRLLSHFENTHVKYAIKLEPFCVLSCRLYNSKYHDRGHYHCPLCFFLTHDKNILTSHYKKHYVKDKESKQMDDAEELAEAKNPDVLDQYNVTVEHCSTEEK